MRYRITLSRSAAKELDSVPSKIHNKIIGYLRQLEENPRLFGAEKLTGIDAYKLRVGSFRIVYKINDPEKEVEVVMIEDRKQVYQRLRRKR